MDPIREMIAESKLFAIVERHHPIEKEVLNCDITPAKAYKLPAIDKDGHKTGKVFTVYDLSADSKFNRAEDRMTWNRTLNKKWAEIIDKYKNPKLVIDVRLAGPCATKERSLSDIKVGKIELSTSLRYGSLIARKLMDSEKSCLWSECKNKLDVSNDSTVADLHVGIWRRVYGRVVNLINSFTGAQRNELECLIRDSTLSEKRIMAIKRECGIEMLRDEYKNTRPSAEIIKKLREYCIRFLKENTDSKNEAYIEHVKEAMRNNFENVGMMLSCSYTDSVNPDRYSYAKILSTAHYTKEEEAKINEYASKADIRAQPFEYIPIHWFVYFMHKYSVDKVVEMSFEKLTHCIKNFISRMVPHTVQELQALSDFNRELLNSVISKSEAEEYFSALEDEDNMIERQYYTSGRPISTWLERAEENGLSIMGALHWDQATKMIAEKFPNIDPCCYCSACVNDYLEGEFATRYLGLKEIEESLKVAYEIEPTADEKEKSLIERVKSIYKKRIQRSAFNAIRAHRHERKRSEVEIREVAGALVTEVVNEPVEERVKERNQESENDFNDEVSDENSEMNAPEPISEHEEHIEEEAQEEAQAQEQAHEEANEEEHIEEEAQEEVHEEHIEDEVHEEAHEEAPAPHDPLDALWQEPMSAGLCKLKLIATTDVGRAYVQTMIKEGDGMPIDDMTGLLNQMLGDEEIARANIYGLTPDKLDAAAKVAMTYLANLDDDALRRIANEISNQDSILGLMSELHNRPATLEEAIAKSKGVGIGVGACMEKLHRYKYDEKMTLDEMLEKAKFIHEYFERLYRNENDKKFYNEIQRDERVCEFVYYLLYFVDNERITVKELLSTYDNGLVQDTTNRYREIYNELSKKFGEGKKAAHNNRNVNFHALDEDADDKQKRETRERQVREHPEQNSNRRAAKPRMVNGVISGAHKTQRRSAPRNHRMTVEEYADSGYQPNHRANMPRYNYIKSGQATIKPAESASSNVNVARRPAQARAPKANRRVFDTDETHSITIFRLPNGAVTVLASSSYTVDVLNLIQLTFAGKILGVHEIDNDYIENDNGSIEMMSLVAGNQATIMKIDSKLATDELLEAAVNEFIAVHYVQ